MLNVVHSSKALTLRARNARCTSRALVYPDRQFDRSWRRPANTYLDGGRFSFFLRPLLSPRSPYRKKNRLSTCEVSLDHGLKYAYRDGIVRRRYGTAITNRRGVERR